MFLTLFFICLLLGFVGKLAILAFKATWGIAKILLFIIFLPLVLVGLVLGGLLYIAFPILIICGIIALLCRE
ncbi:hypothetical protein SAMN02910358_01809 [Lachnospiraceae bacterium XBB1006]|nr:hypothetical protein SAMN02910358_01809 [Lachnospiraceae bacterium XBB1006]